MTALAVLAMFTAVSMAIVSAGWGLALGRPSVRRSLDRVTPALGAASLAFGVWYAWRANPRSLRALTPGKETSMTKVLYTAHARVTGGRVNGHGRTSDGELEVDLRVPEEMGGPGGGTNPEELFAVGYAACFEGALATVARRQRLDAGDATIDSAVSLFPTGDGAFAIAVTLDVSLPSVERETAAGLVREAHQVCPYSNATRGNIAVDLLLSGEPI